MRGVWSEGKRGDGEGGQRLSGLLKEASGWETDVGGRGKGSVTGGQQILHFDFAYRQVALWLKSNLPFPVSTGLNAWGGTGMGGGGVGSLSGPGLPCTALWGHRYSEVPPKSAELRVNFWQPPLVLCGSYNPSINAG